MLPYPAREPRAKYPENWKEIKAAVYARDNYQCRKCGADVRYTRERAVHHIIPLSRGGSNLKNNLMTVCEDCHEKFHPHLEKHNHKKDVSNKPKKYFSSVSRDPLLGAILKKTKNFKQKR